MPQQQLQQLLPTQSVQPVPLHRARSLTEPHLARRPPSRWPYVFSYLERAKALLREAGLASGFETTITSGSSGTEKELVTIVQSDLAKIGINARLEVLEESVYRP
ncbi:MAG: ABC transporter substrate-binding protein, partial [Actinomycetota bacterium]